MIRAFSTFLLTLAFAGSIGQTVPDPQDPPVLLNDFAKVLTQQEQSSLERKLRAYEDTTSTQVTVVIIKSLEGYDVLDLAYRIGEKWGVGQEGKNNGLVILVAIDDHKAAIATGYGMEGAIPDVATRRIRENYMNPNFRNGNFYKGLDEATTALFRLASGEYTADDLKPENRGGGIFGLFFVLFIILLIILSAINRTKKNHFGRKKMDFWTALWLISAMGGGRHRAGGDSWGGGFGGGSSGGGFGGFGGGGFGGGGSGGSW